jgi:carbon-monoxide dehydrogenase small subunit
MMMAAKQLLDDCPHPDEEQIRQGISGNLCRCTGYAKIVDAVKLAAGR